MGQSTEELSTDIAGTRQNLASDLDALQDRVSPQAIMDRRKAAVRGRVSSVKEKVMGSGHSASSTASSTVGDTASAVGQQVQGSPLGAGLVAFGAGLVVAGLFPATRMESNVAQKATDLAQEHGQPLKDEAASAAREMGDNLKEAGTKAADEVKSTAQDSAARVQEKSPVGGNGSDPGNNTTY